MTDHIRIDVQDGDYPAPPSIVIDQNLARQIVALTDLPARIAALEAWSERHRSGEAAPHPAQDAKPDVDEAAVKALMDVKVNSADYACNGWGSPYGASARAILAAIRRGEVPGIYTFAQIHQREDDLRAKLEHTEDLYREVAVHRDHLAARVKELEADAHRCDMAWVSCADRMPDPMTWVLVSDGETVREDRWYPYRELGGRGLLPSDPRCATTPAVPRWATYTNVTHWLPLPSTPRTAPNPTDQRNAGEHITKAVQEQARVIANLNEQLGAARARSGRLAEALRKFKAECGMQRISYTLSPQDYTEADILLAEAKGIDK